MAESFSVWGCGPTCPPLPPLPHVVQVRDTWRRRPIGSFKPRRGSGGGGGRLGKREEGAGDNGWMNGEGRARGRRGRRAGRGTGGCHPEGSRGQMGKGLGVKGAGRSRGHVFRTVIESCGVLGEIPAVGNEFGGSKGSSEKAWRGEAKGD